MRSQRWLRSSLPRCWYWMTVPIAPSSFSRHCPDKNQWLRMARELAYCNPERYCAADCLGRQLDEVADPVIEAHWFTTKSDGMWNGATGAIARGTSRSTACAHKRRFVPAWRWICGVKRKLKDGNKPSPHSIRPGLDKPGDCTTV